MATLRAKCSLEMDCPKDVVVWNYYDHEHVVGTHYKYYSHFRILAERDDWCLVERFYKLPIIHYKTSSVGLMYGETPDRYRSIQFGKLGLRLEQEIQLDELDRERCRVTCTYAMDVPAPFLAFQPLFERLIAQWFRDTWEEDAPMRVRRWKVWKLGFRDFKGIDYINNKTARKPDPEGFRPYGLRLPVPKTFKRSEVAEYHRPFDHSVEVGY